MNETQLPNFNCKWLWVQIPKGLFSLISMTSLIDGKIMLFFSFFNFNFILKLMVKHLTFTNLKRLDGVFHKFLSLFQSKGQPKNLSNQWAIEEGEIIYFCPLTNYNWTIWDKLMPQVISIEFLDYKTTINTRFYFIFINFGYPIF